MTNAKLQSVEIGVANYRSAAETVKLAQEAEALGIARFWLAENYYFRSVTSLTAATVLGTRSIDIGLGVLNWFTRAPTLIGMEAATLQEMSGGRLSLGLGAGRTPASHLGLDLARTVPGLRETVRICRSLLAGDTVDHQGEIYRLEPGAVQLGFHSPLIADVPIYLAGMGPRTLRLAGEVGDGVFLDVFTPPGFIRAMKPHVEEGLAASGRSLDDVWFGSYALFSVSHDPEAARDALRPTLVDYLRARKMVDERLDHAGIDREAFADLRRTLQSAWERGGVAAAADHIPDWIFSSLTVCGTPDECVEGLRAFAEAGVQSVVLFNVLGPDPHEGLRLVAEEVMPALGM